MTESSPRNIWSYATFLLWMVFFALGYLAEETYDAFRLVGHVVPQYAMVNSASVITFSFSGYLAYFSYQRCREIGQNSIDAQGRALQIFVVGLLAFLTLPMDNVLQASQIPSAYTFYRNLIYIVFACKSLACLYLVILVARYYVFGKEQVFARLISMFPSVRYQSDDVPPRAATPEPEQATEEAAGR